MMSPKGWDLRLKFPGKIFFQKSLFPLKGGGRKLEHLEALRPTTTPSSTYSVLLSELSPSPARPLEVYPRLKKLCPGLFPSQFLQLLLPGITQALWAARSWKMLLKPPGCHHWATWVMALLFPSSLGISEKTWLIWGFYHRNSPGRERQLAKEKHLKIAFSRCSTGRELSGRALLLWNPMLELFLYFEINAVPWNIKKKKN